MLDFLYYPIAFVMKMWHALWSTFIDPASGVAWVLSIMFLVITIRVLLFPLFVKQIKSQRAMQQLQPHIARLKEEFKGDRQGFAEAQMKLNKEMNVNPLAGCLPILLQAPVFISLLHVLRRLAPGAAGLYSWDDQLTTQAATATVFGAPISSNFSMTGAKLNTLMDATQTTSTNIKIVTAILIVTMCITQFISTKQIMKRSGPIDNQQMQLVQKLMLYGAPAGLLVSGTFFPLGVLIYWFTNNLWTIGQQFYVLKKMPPPGARGGTPIEDKPVVDPKKLAPRPGAKPTKTSSKPAVLNSGSDAVDVQDSAGTTTTLSPKPKKGATNASAKPSNRSVAKPVGPVVKTGGAGISGSNGSAPKANGAVPKVNGTKPGVGSAPAGAARKKRKK